MKILFLCLSGLKFESATPDHQPLGGTESAVCYLKNALTKRGHYVSIQLAGEQQFKLGDYDIIIVPNGPYIFPQIKYEAPHAKVILWNHHTPDQPAMSALHHADVRKVIESAVFVSERQKQMYVNFAPWGREFIDSPVIGNAIAPCFENMFSSPEELLDNKECRGAYTSTPFRGLKHLKEVEEIPIDVYSSMAVYQQSDEPFLNLYKILSRHPALILHGSLSQPKLAHALKKSAFLVYPCTFLECHSIALLEALASGCRVVTTRAAVTNPDFVAQADDVNDFKALLSREIYDFKNNPQAWACQRYAEMKHMNQEYNWQKRALEWETLLENTIMKKAA